MITVINGHWSSHLLQKIFGDRLRFVYIDLLSKGFKKIINEFNLICALSSVHTAHIIVRQCWMPWRTMSDDIGRHNWCRPMWYVVGHANSRAVRQLQQQTTSCGMLTPPLNPCVQLQQHRTTLYDIVRCSTMSCAEWTPLYLPQFFTARCTLVQSAVLRSHVVCLSVRPSVCLSVCL